MHLYGETIVHFRLKARNFPQMFFRQYTLNLDRVPKKSIPLGGWDRIPFALPHLRGGHWKFDVTKCSQIWYQWTERENLSNFHVKTMVWKRKLLEILPVIVCMTSQNQWVGPCISRIIWIWTRSESVQDKGYSRSLYFTFVLTMKCIS